MVLLDRGCPAPLRSPATGAGVAQAVEDAQQHFGALDILVKAETYDHEMLRRSVA